MRRTEAQTGEASKEYATRESTGSHQNATTNKERAQQECKSRREQQRRVGGKVKGGAGRRGMRNKGYALVHLEQLRLEVEERVGGVLRVVHAPLQHVRERERGAVDVRVRLVNQRGGHGLGVPPLALQPRACDVMCGC